METCLEAHLTAAFRGTKKPTTILFTTRSRNSGVLRGTMDESALSQVGTLGSFKKLEVPPWTQRVCIYFRTDLNLFSKILLQDLICFPYILFKDVLRLISRVFVPSNAEESCVNGPGQGVGSQCWILEPI